MLGEVGGRSGVASAGTVLREIRHLIDVKTSTLATWCRDIQPTAEQVQAIKERTGSRAGIPVDTQWRRGTGHRKNHLEHGVCRVRLYEASDSWNRVMAWIQWLSEWLPDTLVSRD